jgi:hypothetical protein
MKSTVVDYRIAKITSSLIEGRSSMSCMDTIMRKSIQYTVNNYLCHCRRHNALYKTGLILQFSCKYFFGLKMALAIAGAT